MMSFRGMAGKVKRKIFSTDLLHQLLGDSARILGGVEQIASRLYYMELRVRALQEALGRVEGRQVADRPVEGLEDTEFRVYSQWGEDGIIRHLCRHVPIERKIFVEFGVEVYEEANTRFLLVDGNWSGLVIECDPAQAARIRQSREYWLYNLKVAEAMVTRENINRLLEQNGVTGRIGLLSIDVDGMDYWIWEAIEVIEPAIVVVEYNHRFGPDAAVTVPYQADFDRRQAHHSILYFGASLRALCLLAERKGYDFVGANSHGLNAFFVRKDIRPEAIPVVSPEEGFRAGQFCEAHDEAGRRVKMSPEEESRLVWSLPLEHVDATDGR